MTSTYPIYYCVGLDCISWLKCFFFEFYHYVNLIGVLAIAMVIYVDTMRNKINNRIYSPY